MQQLIDHLNIELASHFEINILFFGTLNPLVILLDRLVGFQKSIHYCILDTTSGFNIQIINSLCNPEGTLHLV